jgi:hypothetical protein
MLSKLVNAAKDTAKKLLQWWKKKVPVAGDDQPHTLQFQGEKKAAKLVIQSDPTDPVVFMTNAAKKAGKTADESKDAIGTTRTHVTKIKALQVELAAFDDNKAAATADKTADTKAKALDDELTALATHMGTVLATWQVGDPEITGVTITRGSFTVEHKRNIAAEAATISDTAKHLRPDSRVELINVAKGIARRHIVSASDMGKHYMSVLNDKKHKVSAGKLLLEQRGSLPEARTPVRSPTVVAIREAAVERYTKFFGYAKNIFLGDSRENSSIQEKLDKKRPDMAEAELREHVARIKRSFALDDTFKPTE